MILVPASSLSAILPVSSSGPKMMDRSNSQYDSFLFWRQPIPELDLSELEDLGLLDAQAARSAAGRDDSASARRQEDEVSQVSRYRCDVIIAADMLSCRQQHHFAPTSLSSSLSAGLPVRVFLLHLLARSSRWRRLSAGWPQPAAVKPSSPDLWPHTRPSGLSVPVLVLPADANCPMSFCLLSVSDGCEERLSADWCPSLLPWWALAGVSWAVGG